MANWRGLALCDSCLHRQACDYRLPLGQPPNPLCLDGWIEGPNPAHTIPGPDYRPASEMGKYPGESQRDRARTAQYSLRHFCLMCACWERQHTPVTNASRTWLCRRHLRVFQAWKRKRGLPPLAPSRGKRRAANREKRRQAVVAFLTPGPRSLREIATALDWSTELARYHLNRLAQSHEVERVPLVRGQSWIAWQLIASSRIDSEKGVELCKENVAASR